MRIIFAGTPDFSVGCLQALLDSEHEVCAVYSQPDRPAGRGRKCTASPVKQCALDNNIAVYQPERLDVSAIDELVVLNADLMIVVAYGLILPKAVLVAPKLGCLNVHASLLPRWRGAAPIQRAILAGDAISGITIMQMDEGLDTGAMLLKRETSINQEDNGGSLHDRLANLGAEALIDALHALHGLQQGRLHAEPQDDALSCYAAKLNKQEARIDWGLPALQLERQIRAFNPWPVSQCSWKDKTLRLWQAKCLECDSITESNLRDQDSAPGTVLNSSANGIDVMTGDGVLRLLALQLPGKRPMSVADFVNGRNLTNVQLS